MESVATPEQKRRTVERISTSETFRRSEQLKKLLAYLVDQEIAGRIHEVTEYEIATHALGRPAEFSPDVDSSVRTRMHGLRQKLEEYFKEEDAAAPVRIEFPRGSYRPQFVIVPPPVIVPTPRVNWGWTMPGAATLVGLLVLAVAGWWIWAPTPFEKLWGPIWNDPQAVTLLVAQPVHVWVRDVSGQPLPEQYMHFPDAPPESPAFQRFMQGRLRAGAKLALHPSPNATLWGDAAGAAAAARFLAFRNVQSNMVPESMIKSEVALRGNSLLVFGRPEYSPTIERYLLGLGGYTVGMRNDLRRYAIYRRGNVGEPFLNTNPPNEVNHGLISVLEEGGHRVMIFSGITSDGSIAGLDFMTNSDSVAALWKEVRKEGLEQWPKAFQVIVRVESSSGYAMVSRYQHHLVLQK